MKTPLPLLFWSYCVLTGTKTWADTITLKDGRQISGLVQMGSAGEIKVKLSGGFQVIAISTIQSIEFAGSDSLAPIPPPPPPVYTTPQSLTLPIDTEIAVRTVDRIDSKKADTYKEYAASLDDPIIVNGVTVVPANANAFLKVSDIHSAGVTRRASLSTTLIAFVINGQRVTVQTGKVDSQSGSQAKRTAAATLAGAAAGAGIGVMIGGPVGAAVGGGVGAVGGAVTGSVMGKPVEIAPETRFTYKLTQPVAVTFQGSAQ